VLYFLVRYPVIVYLATMIPSRFEHRIESRDALNDIISLE
jgi:hypothetical protein